MPISSSSARRRATALRPRPDRARTIRVLPGARGLAALVFPLCIPLLAGTGGTTAAGAAAPPPCTTARFLPDPHADGARAGAAVAISADGRFAFGIPGRDEVRFGSIDAQSGLARLDGTLRGAAGSRFGAALALAAGRLVVGAPDSGTGGAAFLFDLAAPAAPPVELRPAAATPGARAGLAVAFADDRILLGAPSHGVAGAPSGAVFLFERAAGSWSEVATLLPIDHGAEGGFGEAVALDGDRIAVGAPRAASARGECGAVHLFAPGAAGAGAPPAPLGIIALADGVADEAFGAAVAFAGGDLAIGVPHRDAASPGAGTIAIVSRSTLAAAAASAPHARIAPDLLLARRTSPAAAALGAALAAAGEWLVAGAPADGGAAPLAGAVALFRRDPAAPADRRYREEALLLPDPAAPGGELGRAVAIALVAGEGTARALLIAGAPGDPERCGGAFGCDGGSAQLALVAGGADCDGDGIADPCALLADPALDADGDGVPDRCRFRRGDLDGDGALTLADPVRWLAGAFAGALPGGAFPGSALPGGGIPGGTCPAAADANADGALDLADPVALLEHLFQGAPPPPAPFPGCGTGASGSLPCAGRGCVH